jgi:hypothetical protein
VGSVARRFYCLEASPKGSSIERFHMLLKKIKFKCYSLVLVRFLKDLIFATFVLLFCWKWYSFFILKTYESVFKKRRNERLRIAMKVLMF